MVPSTTCGGWGPRGGHTESLDVQGHTGEVREKRLNSAQTATQTQATVRYLGAKPQLAGQVVVSDLLRELDTKIPWGSVLGNAHIHDLVNHV